VKWRTGLILQYGNLTLLSIEEMLEGMFPADEKGIMVFAEEQWQEYSGTSKIFGIEITTPDLYPVLKFPEARKKYKRVNRGQGQQASHDPSTRGKREDYVDICVEEPRTVSHDLNVTNRMVSIDQIDSEFEKLKIRLDHQTRSYSQGEWPGEAPNGRLSPAPVRKNGVK
jgi:hypothetical protein